MIDACPVGTPAVNQMLYEVEARFTDAQVASRWVDWILKEHIAEVVAAGASCGRLVRLDGAELRFVVQYEFAVRMELDHYLDRHAARLREAAATRFPLDRVQYTRRIGEILRP